MVGEPTPPQPDGGASPSSKSSAPRPSDVERFERAHRSITEKARELGESHHRRRRGFREFDLKAEIHREVAELRDVFERHPDCADAVAEIRNVHLAIGVERRLDADRFAVELAKNIRGFAVQFHRIASLLIDRSDAELRLIETAFEDRYRESFTDALDRMIRSSRTRVLNLVLRRELVTERVRIGHILAGHRVDAYADTLYLALRWRWGKDELAIFSALEHLAVAPEAAKQLTAVRERYEARYEGRFGVDTLREALEAQLSATKAARALALLDGNRVLATVIALADELGRRVPRMPVVTELLEEKTRRQLKAIRAEWRRHRGRSIAEELGQRQWKPKHAPIRDAINALVDGKSLTADAALLRVGMLGHAGCWVGSPFVGRNFAERRGLIERYERMYRRSFWVDLRKKVRDRTRFLLMESFIKRGRLSKAELLRDCMHGFGTDEQGIKDILDSSTADEVREIEVEYRKFLRYDFVEGLRLRPWWLLRRLRQAVWEQMRSDGSVTFRDQLRHVSLVPRDLWMDLEAELDGDDWLDAQLLRDGKPGDPLDLYRRTEAVYEHERGGRFSRVIDWVCHDGEAMDRDFGRARKYYEQYIENKEPTPNQLHRLHALVSYANHAFESFRSAKHSMSFMLANLLSGLSVGVVAMVVLTLKQPILVVMAGCFLVSAFTRMTCRWTLSARGYGRERMVQDVALASVDGVTFAAGTAFRQLFGGIGRRVLRSKIAHRIIKGTSSFVLKRLVRTSEELNEKKRSKHLHHDKKLEGALESEERDVNEVLERLSIYT